LAGGRCSGLWPSSPFVSWDCATNRDFLRGVARLGRFLARKSDSESGWQTIWKGWFVLMILVEGYELAPTIASPK
jgi:hypothetical protein